MVIGFKPQFVPKILDGTKKHTVRVDAKNRYEIGKTLHMATGVRTKNYNCFKVLRITGIQKISIYKNHFVYIDGKLLNTIETNLFAENDGFNGEKDFFEWFSNAGNLFEGKVIHWTDLMY